MHRGIRVGVDRRQDLLEVRWERLVRYPVKKLPISAMWAIRTLLPQPTDPPSAVGSSSSQSPVSPQAILRSVNFLFMDSEADVFNFANFPALCGSKPGSV